MESVIVIFCFAFLLFFSLVVGAIFRSEVLHVDMDGESRVKAFLLSAIVGFVVISLLVWVVGWFE